MIPAVVAAPRGEAESLLAAAARRVSRAAPARAAALDREGAFPVEDMAALAAEGLLAACVPRHLGGAGLGSDALGSPELLAVLRLVGRGNLSLGRVYEGHVNAWRLIARHGTELQQRRLAEDARAGRLFAVWNTPGDGVRLEADERGGGTLRGAKTFASGTGQVARPLITVRWPDGSARMVVVPLRDSAAGADPTVWQAQGMRASVSGTFDFTGVEIRPTDVLGGPGDYERQPDFSAGAWRFAAVHLGGLEAVAEAALAHLRRTGRGDDPHQRARVGQIAAAAETAALWMARAAERTAQADADPESAMAYVNLARLAVERAALDVLELAQRSVGVQAFVRPHPLERLGRDLATYLRQPNPDGALAAAAGHVLAREAHVGDLWR